MPRKSDTDGQDKIDKPVVQTFTLELKQTAYWKGVLCKAGTRFQYSKPEAQRLLLTTDLFRAV